MVTREGDLERDSGFRENWVEGGVRISFCFADAFPLGRFPACGEAGDLCLMGGAEEIVRLPLFSLTNSVHSCLPRCGYRIFQSHPLWSTLFFFRDVLSGQGFLN